MGDAYGVSELGTRSKALSPCVVLSRNVKATCNFGGMCFYLRSISSSPLHFCSITLSLPTAQLQSTAHVSRREADERVERALHSGTFISLPPPHVGILFFDLFCQYCDLSNKEAAASGEEDFEDSIFEAGIDAFLQDLHILDDMDPGLFVVSWKLGCATPWVISKTEWMNGWPLHGASNAKEMQKKLTEWRKELVDPHAFTLFYNWVFDYMRGDKRILDWEQTKILWQVVLNEKKVH